MVMHINLYQATRIDVCAWCGKFYDKHHPVQKYCSKECAKEAKKERTRVYQRMRRKLKRELPLGTSNLRGSRQKNFEREMELVEREYGRVFNKYSGARRDR